MHHSESAVSLAEGSVERHGAIEALLRSGEVPLQDLAPREAMPGADVVGNVLRGLLEALQGAVEVEPLQGGEAHAAPGAAARRVAPGRAYEIVFRRRLVLAAQGEHAQGHERTQIVR